MLASYCDIHMLKSIQRAISKPKHERDDCSIRGTLGKIENLCPSSIRDHRSLLNVQFLSSLFLFYLCLFSINRESLPSQGYMISNSKFTHNQDPECRLNYINIAISQLHYFIYRHLFPLSNFQLVLVCQLNIGSK